MPFQILLASVRVIFKANCIFVNQRVAVALKIVSTSRYFFGWTKSTF
ncbi:hypothetical protein RCH18_000778 [Flavobacterium sp. PL11]|nr:hypothetical protein [Flavobacterium sp. PL11]